MATVEFRYTLSDTVCVVFSYFYNIHQLTSSFHSTKEKPNICSVCFFACGDPSSLTRHRKRFHEYHPKSKVGKSRRKRKKKVVPHGVETHSMGSANVINTPLPYLYFAQPSSSQQSNTHSQTATTAHYQSFQPELEGPSSSQNPLSMYPPIDAGSLMAPHHSFFAPATEEYYAQAWSNVDPSLDVFNSPREDIPSLSGFPRQAGNSFGFVVDSHGGTSSSWPLALEQQHEQQSLLPWSSSSSSSSSSSYHWEDRMGYYYSRIDYYNQHGHWEEKM